MFAQIRKELAAAVTAAVSAWLAAYANGGWPNWLTVGLCVLLGVVVGVVALSVRNARPVPKVAQHIAIDGDVAPALKMAIRAAQRNGGRLM